MEDQLAQEEHEFRATGSPYVETSDPAVCPLSCCYVRARFSLVALGFFMNFFQSGMMVNMSVALVAMVNSTGGNGLEYSYCKGWVNSSRPTADSEFDWDINTQGWILSAFTLGLILTPLPSGWLSGHYGGKWPAGLSLLLTALLTIASPYAAYKGSYPVIAVRILTGAASGMNYPAIQAMYGAWIPPGEKSVSSSLALSGYSLGNMAFEQISGILASSGFLQGWPAVFYVTGGAGLLFCPFWFLLAYSTPTSHPWIKREEQQYITTSLCHMNNQETFTVPWRKMFTSKPVLALATATTCANFADYLFLSEMPSYLIFIQGFAISDSGFLSSMQYLMSFICKMSAATAADICIQKSCCKVGSVRKVTSVGAMLISTASLLAAAYSGCNGRIVVITLMFAAAATGPTFSGLDVNFLDIAPRFAGIISGLISILNNAVAIVGPVIVSALTQDQGMDGWKEVFWITSGILWFGSAVFLIWGSGERQVWDEENSTASERQPLLTQ